MVAEAKEAEESWIWADSVSPEGRARPFEFSLIRTEDNVRVVLVMLLLVIALSTPAVVTNRVAAYTSLVIGVFLTFWTRYAADWLRLRREGQLGAGALVVVLADFVWLSLLVIGTGGMDSPFRALLLTPILFSVSLFSRLRIAVMLVTSMVVIAYTGIAVAGGVSPDEPWQLTGALLTIMTLAWVAYGLSLVLERERRANELVIRYMSEAVVLVDGAGRIILANEQLRRVTGIAPGQIVGLDVHNIPERLRCENVDALLADISEDFTDTSPRVRETEMTVANAETLDVRITTVFLVTPTGEPVGWVVICQDVTGVKSVVRLQEKGISMLSHEIRSPLTTLKAAAAMLAAVADKMNDETFARLGETIKAETQRLLMVAGELLNISNLDTPAGSLQKEETDLRSLVTKVSRVAMLVASGKDISVSTEFKDPLPHIEADPQRLSDALQRLCDNAIKYSEPGGEVGIAVAREDGQVCISVSDTGPGIPPEQRESIFGKFTQLEDDTTRDKSERGAGLGLYVVKRVAELHGGRVEIDSEPGRGSTFTLRLPVEPA